MRRKWYSISLKGMDQIFKMFTFSFRFYLLLVLLGLVSVHRISTASEDFCGGVHIID